MQEGSSRRAPCGGRLVLDRVEPSPDSGRDQPGEDGHCQENLEKWITGHRVHRSPPCGRGKDATPTVATCGANDEIHLHERERTHSALGLVAMLVLREAGARPGVDGYSRLTAVNLAVDAPQSIANVPKRASRSQQRRYEERTTCVGRSEWPPAAPGKRPPAGRACASAAWHAVPCAASPCVSYQASATSLLVGIRPQRATPSPARAPRPSCAAPSPPRR
jgi:hypothetical protein